MGLRLVARYYDRSEALIASGALDAAGVPNWIENLNMITISPFREIAYHGYRLMVVDDDIDDAVAVLREALRKRSFEGERLSTTHRTMVTIVLFFLSYGVLWLPLKRHRWYDV